MRMIKLATFAVPLVALGLYGCTIVTNPQRPANQAPPPPPPPPAAEPAPAPATPPANNNTVKVPSTGKGDQAAPPPQMKPMSAPNVFGRHRPFGNSFDGQVFFIDAGARSLPDLSALQPVTRVYLQSFNIRKQDFKRGFPGVDPNRLDWFAIRYTSDYVVDQAGEYMFRLVSDDGAKLYVDNVLVANNDGVHPATEKVGLIKLAPGTHQLQLDYFQGTLQVALQLYVTPPGGKEQLWRATPKADKGGLTPRRLP